MKPKELLKRAKRDGNPLIRGETVTFVWKGKKPPYLLGDFNFWNVFDSEFNGGHNYIAWRDMLPEAMETLFDVESRMTVQP